MNIQKLELLKTENVITSLNYLEETGSTNNLAKERARQLIEARNKLRINELFLTEIQTAGRGRLGREWDSPSGTGIWMSFLTNPRLNSDHISGVTLLAAMSIIKAINTYMHRHSLFNIDVKIKWPNDIVVRGKKICGILSELVASEESNYIICGIGINVNTMVFKEDICKSATSLLNESGIEWKREELIYYIISNLKDYIGYYESENSLEFIKEDYNNILISMNKEVNVISHSTKETTRYICRGINNYGAMIVEDKSGIHEIASGEVSVRGIYGYT